MQTAGYLVGVGGPNRPLRHLVYLCRAVPPRDRTCPAAVFFIFSPNPLCFGTFDVRKRPPNPLISMTHLWVGLAVFRARASPLPLFLLVCIVLRIVSSIAGS